MGIIIGYAPYKTSAIITPAKKTGSIRFGGKKTIETGFK